MFSNINYNRLWICFGTTLVITLGLHIGLGDYRDNHTVFDKYQTYDTENTDYFKVRTSQIRLNNHFDSNTIQNDNIYDEMSHRIKNEFETKRNEINSNIVNSPLKNTKENFFINENINVTGNNSDRTEDIASLPAYEFFASEALKYDSAKETLKMATIALNLLLFFVILGFIVGIFSLYTAKKNENNKLLLKEKVYKIVSNTESFYGIYILHFTSFFISIIPMVASYFSPKMSLTHISYFLLKELYYMHLWAIICLVLFYSYAYYIVREYCPYLIQPLFLFYVFSVVFLIETRGFIQILAPIYGFLYGLASSKIVEFIEDNLTLI